ncbi:hypothetical protein KIN20_034214 [Parelaphostrongylus tenuis]|uniref:DOMON domain-containing protein n=1 Tax=Parelaphostrongylus tenuis TaxID=148309 RepID=A0AAD5R9F4_PARTN|nr:hypothetical protein KIN20_034214 [Parelaphostrongylus tenuis]
MFVDLIRMIMATLAVFVIGAELSMNRDGCGKTKACLFKPAGCDPNLDCTIGLIFYVVGPNQLRIEMVATSLMPPVDQQYIAIAFSNDTIMGDDFVTECVLSKTMGEFSDWEPEIFVSYNHGKSNDRIFLNDDEYRTLISNISSQVVDSRLVCHFTQQIIPQIDRKDGLLIDLDKDFYIFGATGSAQPDEVNAHDTNHGSHFYPIVSSAKINPSQVGNLKMLKKDQSVDRTVIAPPPVDISSFPPSTEPTILPSSTYSETVDSYTPSLNPLFYAMVLLFRLLI